MNIDHDAQSAPDAAAKQQHALVEQLSEIQNEIVELTGQIDVIALVEAVAMTSAASEAVAALSTADSRDESAESSNRALALQAVTALTAARLQLESAPEVVETMTIDTWGLGGRETAIEAIGRTRAAMGRHRSTLAAIIGKLKASLAHVWHLLSRLITPKEWKISGEVSGGIPALGLVKAGIEVTFG